VIALGCGREAPDAVPPVPAAPPVAPIEPVPSTPSEPAPPNDAPLVETWVEVPALERRTPARPVPFPQSAGPKLVIFGGSWCPACVASVFQDIALAERFRDRMEIGVGIYGEDDPTFMRSTYSRWLSSVPVWSARSAAPVSERCGVSYVPAACLLDGERVLWLGPAADAGALVDAQLAGRLDETLRRYESADEIARQALATREPEAFARAIEALRGLPGRENTIAWDLVGSSTPPPNELAFAVEIARDATNATSGLDSAILDTYAVALWKSQRWSDAARVAARVIAVCDATQGPCGEERRRADSYLAAAAPR
jgi:hypothetical protein